MYFLPLMLILFTFGSYAQCPINYDLGNLFTASNIFTTTSSVNIPDNHAQNFAYIFPVAFQSVPSSALAINSFDIDSTQISIMSFSLVVTALTNLNMNLTFNYNTKAFALLQVNYLIGNRNDLVLGFYQHTVNNSQFTIALNRQIISSLNSTISRVFINGFRFNKNQSINNKLNVSLSVTTISKQHLTLFLGGFSLNSMQTIWFSYIVFSPVEAAFASYGGSITQTSFSGNQLYNLNSIIYRTPYKFFGISNIALSRNINLGNSSRSMQFSFLIDENMIGSLVSSSTQINYINVDYIILGNTPKSYCSSCQSFPYASASECVSQCPSNTYLINYRDGGRACMICSLLLGLQLNQEKTQCTCINGRVLDSNGYCNLEQTTLTSLNTQTINKDSILNQPSQPISQNTSQTNNEQSSEAIGIINSAGNDTTCSLIPNAYWSGVQCVCKTGYRNISGKCIEPSSNVQGNYLPLPLWMINNQQNSAYSLNMYGANGNSNNDNSNNNNNVVQNPCGVNQFLSNGICTCLPNYFIVQGFCQPQNQKNECPSNSFNNGLGVCICLLGYYNISGVCKNIQSCPPNSLIQSNGSCICNQGYINVSNYCLICKPGQYYDQTNSVCVQNCGSNSIYNINTSSCQCIINYGIKTDGICELCLGPQFKIINNFCVSCPINQQFIMTTQTCQCKDGYYMPFNGGGCLYKCAINQVYNPSTLNCNCVTGLGRVNGVCQICTNSTIIDLKSQNCVACQPNSYYFNGGCACQTGFVMTSIGQCFPCSLISNSFMINGTCATCPGQKIFNGLTCVCPQGTTAVGLSCVESCLNDQNIDQNGDCFRCPPNQYYANSSCQCKNNYITIGNGVCQLRCLNGQFQYKGRCAICPFNLQYYPVINGCACPAGYFLNNNMQCIFFVGSPITCPSSQYLNPNLGCVNCQINNCLTCSAANNCTQCASNYKKINGNCVNYCGDGIISPVQKCDDGNINNNDGCSSTCLIQPFYICAGQPSACRYTGYIINPCGNGLVQGDQACDDKNTISGDGCSTFCAIETGYTCSGQPSNCSVIKNSSGLTLHNPVQTNINNVLVTLKTNPVFTFGNQADMQSFMKSSYSSLSQPTTYCIQRQSPQLSLFDCLLIYPSGVPITVFNASFWYNYQGKTGNITLNINPLATGSATRSLR